MKAILTFKTPDVLDQIDELFDLYSSDDNKDFEFMKTFINRYVKYDEYINIEFDSEKKTATVLRK